MPEKVYKTTRNTSKRSRVFVAIPVPDELKTNIEELINKLRDANRFVVWQNMAKAHITLVFLGHIAQERVDVAAQVLKNVASHIKNFEVVTGLLDYFYTGDDGNSVIYLSIKDPDKNLRELYNQLKKSLGNEDFYPPERLHPHITLGMMKKERDRNLQTQKLEELTQDESLANISIPVHEVNMYKSLQERGGATRYKLLRNYSLQ